MLHACSLPPLTKSPCPHHSLRLLEKSSLLLALKVPWVPVHGSVQPPPEVGTAGSAELRCSHATFMRAGMFY